MAGTDSLTDQIRGWFERTPKAQRAVKRLSEDLDVVAGHVEKATSGLLEKVSPIIDPPARATATPPAADPSGAAATTSTVDPSDAAATTSTVDPSDAAAGPSAADASWTGFPSDSSERKESTDREPPAAQP